MLVRQTRGETVKRFCAGFRLRLFPTSKYGIVLGPDEAPPESVQGAAKDYEALHKRPVAAFQGVRRVRRPLHTVRAVRAELRPAAVFDARAVVLRVVPCDPAVAAERGGGDGLADVRPRSRANGRDPQVGLASQTSLQSAGEL